MIIIYYISLFLTSLFFIFNFLFFVIFICFMLKTFLNELIAFTS